ncbi:biotin--[acetyl-CoA-carboxylase] ligase [Amphibacillus sp. Q70]|uniref:biotin--[acetyl-CoA-carboxylase] ligase n=1 Tax=Amphibacillus sp. Q70 TaxID=3453416 RepID=UPI003F82DF5C
MSSTREKLISLLSNQSENFVSGQWLSSQLKISRTAVWKQIKQLEEDGYKFEAIQNKGYRLLVQPDKVSENTLYWGLDTKWLGKSLEHYPVLDSTQRLAMEKAQKGAEEGLVVVADKQTTGKGRRQHRWYSNHSGGVWLSFVLHPKMVPAKAPQLTLLTAIAVVQAMESATELKPMIKWPNDILIGDKKIAGILTEMQAEHDEIHYVVIGIGLNVNQTSNDLDHQIKHMATSLLIETEKTYHKQVIIQAILTHFETIYHDYLLNGFEPIRKQWLHYAYRLGDLIHYTINGEENRGILHGIANDGSLIIEDEQQQKQNLYSAEIKWFEGVENNES